MFAIIGIVIVFGCIVAGYLMEHGNLRVLIQPAELIIIGGAAVGTVLVANPLHIIKKIAAGIGGVFGSSKFGKQAYIDTLKMMYDLLNKARKDGLMALENDVEEPDKSPLFSKNPAFLKNHHIRDFVCDSLRMAITGVDAFDLDQMLDLDLEVHHQDARNPRPPSAPWLILCPVSASSRPFLVLSSRWVLLADRRKKSGTRSPRHWLGHFSESCSATD